MIYNFKAKRMTSRKHTGPVGYTGFVHPAAQINTKQFSIGGASLVEPFVSLEGDSAKIGVACNLQDNDRLLNFAAGGKQAQGDLELGDGGFTAHGVTFIGKVRIGQACGTVINAVVQNAAVGDGTLIGPMARVLGQDPQRPIVIPEASLVLFGARTAGFGDLTFERFEPEAGFAAPPAGSPAAA